MTDFSARPSRWAPLVLLALAACYLVVVWPALHGPFVFDDFPNLQVLAKVGHVDSWRALGIYLSEARSFPGRPLAMLSFLAQQSSWPDHTFPFKLVNLLIHVVNAGLVFALARKLVRAAGTTDTRTTWVAGITALIWLVHPMQLSTVLLVIQRMTLLSASFVLLGLLAYAHGLVSSAGSELRRGAWMSLGMGCIVFALLSKENGVLLPLYAWAMDATLLRGSVQTLPTRLRWLRRLLLFPAIAMLALLALSQLQYVGTALATRDFTMSERLLTEPRVLFDYIFNILLPRYSAYSVYHDDFVVSRGLFAPWTTLPAIIGLLASVVTAIVWRARWPFVSFGVLWFVAGQSLESGPISLELYFEHRNYLPMLGIFLSLAAGVANLPDGSVRRVALPLAGVWLLATLMATGLYAQVWSSPERLAYFWSQSRPASLRAQGDYAEILYRAGRIDEARRIIAATGAGSDGDAGVEVSLAIIDCSTGALAKAQVAALEAHLRTSRWSRLAYQGMETLGQMAGAARCPNALDEAAWTELSDAMLANPDFQRDDVAVGYLHYLRHLQAVRQQDLGRALAELDATARVDPDPEIVRLKAKYLADAGRSDTAIELLSGYDGNHRPLLRRLLVDDAAINREGVKTLQESARR